jgi:transposase InsO family protein
MEALEALSKKLGRGKGAQALYKEARKAGIDVTRTQVQDFVANIGSKQVMTQSQPSLGKSATASAANEGSRWQADLVQFRGSLQAEEDATNHYLLLLINVFSRKAHGVVLENKATDTVAAAMRKLLKKIGDDLKGGVLSTDTGAEFMSDEFRQILKTADAAHKTKGTAENNSLAVIDRCIQSLRKDISSRMIESEKTWSEVAAAALVAWNRSINTTVRDAPADVAKEPVLQYLILSDNAKKYEHNKKLARRRVDKVKELKAFRRPEKTTAFGRGFQAKFRDKEDLEDVVSGTLVKGKNDERLVDVKSILAVPASTDTRKERLARPAELDKKRREKTEDLIAMLDSYIPVGQDRPLRSVGPELRSRMGDGVYEATLKSVSRNLAGVIELWPKKYELRQGGARTNVRVHRIS